MINNTFFKRTFVHASMAVCLATTLSGCSESSLEERLAAAEAYIAENDSQAAIIEYKNAIQQAPEAPAPRFALGKLYLQKGDYQGAEKELNRALELGQPAADVVPLLSQAYQQTGAENALLDLDHQSSDLTSVQKAEVGFYKLQALVKLDKENEARELLNELRGLDTSSVYKGLIDSYAAILNEDYDKALTETKALREQAPLNKDVLMQLARLHLNMEQTEQAIEVYQTYVERYPKDIDNRFALITLLFDMNRLSEAKPHVDELLKVNSEHGLLNQFKGIIAASEEDFESALGLLEKAIQNGRNEPVVRLIAGYSAYQLADYEAASRHLSMVASVLPDNHAGLRMYADSLLQQGESADATEVLSRLTGDVSEDAALFSKAGFQLLKEGNVVDAQKMIERTSAISSTSEDLAKLGVLQLSLNDIEGLVNLEAAVEKAPDSNVTQRTLLTAYVATGQLENARKLAKKWIEKEPDGVAPLLAMTEILLLEKNTEQAKQYLDQALAQEPVTSNVIMMKARFELATEQAQQAEATLQGLLNEEPANLQAISMLYSSKAEDGAPELIKHVEEQLSNQPDNTNMRILLARMYFAEGNSEQALATLDSISADKSSPMDMWNLKGQTLLKANKLEAARAHFEEWLELYPQDKNAALGMLLVMDVSNQYQDALSFAEKFLAKRPDNQVKVLKAYFHAMNNEAEPARAILETLPEETRALPFIQGVTGRVLVIEGKPAEAIPYIQAAYDEKNNEQNAMLLAAAYGQAGQEAQALAFLQQHAEQYPNDIRIQILFAQQLIADDTAKAMQVYEHILTLMPENVVVLNNLAYLHFQAGNLDKAQSLAEKAVKQQPKNPEIVDTLAQIEMSKGDTQAALSLYERIVNTEIRSDEVYLNYIEALLVADQTALAKRRLEERTLTTARARAKADKLRATYSL
ncbi:PEP-CTERM system TPR-repeat protein PrsT [Alteromonas sp. ASW11-19]|uniref:PEP-CTERM system TPR-repeat protein PrsT n=1 Tax=Alteromonas salexigens TaxID=2982530 RepID=A0ABT2VIQ6_9ALTE|nr:XrtA/PEP-CTERM system TPR-repeat protein PrsT [Alteromonas salexigens]MCU7553021.1 PEP-CTERM system TPR-repeat protein PrsT [Alteromonas salexigens]